MRRRPAPPVQLPLYGASDGDLGEALDVFLGDVRPSPSSLAAAPTAAETRERAGRAAQRHGEALERWVRGQLEAAALTLWLVFFTKIEVAVAQKRTATGFVLVRAAKAAADFCGCTRDGRFVAIECKATEGQRLPRSAILPQQLAQLDAVALAGGCALLAVEFRAGRYDARQYLLPWPDVPWETARTAQSLTEAAAAPWRWTGGVLFERLRRR